MNQFKPVSQLQLKPWLERDMILIETVDWFEQHVLLDWSIQQKPKIIWPGCVQKFWALTHALVLQLPYLAEKPDKALAQKCNGFLNARGITLVGNAGVYSPIFGCLLFPDNLNPA